jgi:lipoate-protein ligase B
MLDYADAWSQQRDNVAARADGAGGDVLMLLEHPSVYTAGKRTLPEERPADGTPVVDVDRGGKITGMGLASSSATPSSSSPTRSTSWTMSGGWSRR